MKLLYDFHIHTALSPCGQNEMTPNNIVNMALLNDLDVIAVTDHNACENVKAVMEVAQETDLLVIPAMEVETKEEIHVVCLFESLEQCSRLQKQVQERMQIINGKDVFGEQLIMDSQDEIVGKVSNLLTQSSGIPIGDLKKLVDDLGGVFIPAHIDRPSYSIIANLGMIPSNIEIANLEISKYAKLEEYIKLYPKYRILQSSDSHELGHIGACKQFIEVESKTIKDIITFLKTLPN